MPACSSAGRCQPENSAKMKMAAAGRCAVKVAGRILSQTTLRITTIAAIEGLQVRPVPVRRSRSRWSERKNVSRAEFAAIRHSDNDLSG